MLAERKTSLTVTAIAGTGLVTLAVALTGMAGLSNDLRAATLSVQPTTPVTPLLTTDEVRETLRQEALSKKLQADCEDRKKAREAATGTTGPREL